MKFVISKNEMVLLEGNPSEMSIQCEKGMLWITRTGELHDTILKQGEIYTIKEKGKVAVIGQNDSTVSLMGKNLMLNMVKTQNSTRLTCLKNPGLVSLLTLLSPQSIKNRIKSLVEPSTEASQTATGSALT